MADIRPFKGIRYNLQKVTDLTQVIAPPYDVISTDQQLKLHRRNEHNVIRLILGQEQEDDDGGDNKYTRAARCFHRWLEERVLEEDPTETFYVYEQTFTTPGGEQRTRRGFFAAVRLEPLDSGIIRPHEFTLPGPKADRLNLFRAAKANFSPLFGLYDDPESHVTRLLSPVDSNSQSSPVPPVMEAVDDDGVVQRLWLIRDASLTGQIRSAFQDREILIADGHHRYETALAYRDELKAASSTWSGEEPANFVMMVLVSLRDPGLMILPTHRIADLSRFLQPHGDRDQLQPEHSDKSFSLDDFLKKVDEFFTVEEVRRAVSTASLTSLLAERRREHAVGLVAGGRAFILTLRPESLGHPLLSRDYSETYQRLDVNLLHTFVIEPLLGGEDAGCKLTYVKDAEEGIASVRRGEHQMIFLLNPTGLEEVLKVAQAGEKMPQKSTYFYPKLATGLVMRRLWME